MNIAPAYRNINNIYLAYDGDTWLITSEDCFLDDITCGWLRIDTTGTLKIFDSFREILRRKKSDIVNTTMARSRWWLG